MSSIINRLESTLFNHSQLKPSIDTIKVSFEIYNEIILEEGEELKDKYNPYKSIWDLLTKINNDYGEHNYLTYKFDENDNYSTVKCNDYPIGKLRRTNLETTIKKKSKYLQKIKDKNTNRERLIILESFQLELFGLSQPDKIFDLETDEIQHIYDIPQSVKYIFKHLSISKDISNILIRKIDIANDILYPKEKTLIRYHNKYSVENIKGQLKYSNIGIDNFLAVKLIIPIEYKPIISKLKRDDNIINDGIYHKGKKDNYIVPIQFINGNDKICKSNQATHYRFMIRTKEIYFKYISLISDNLVNNSTNNEDIEESITKHKGNAVKFNTIRYDKILKDTDNNYKTIDKTYEYYLEILRVYGIDITYEEYEADMYDLIQWFKKESLHNRFETRCKELSINPMVENEKNEFIESIIKEFNTMDIILYKNKTDCKTYINKQKKDTFTTQLMGKNRLLYVNTKEIKELIDQFFLCFKTDKYST